MKKYDSYKDSGVEWIGEVPTHWGVDILNRIFKINTGFTPSTSNNEFYENGIHDWITIRDLDGKYVSESKTKLTDIAVQGKTIVPKGSLLYSFKLSVGQMAFTTKDIYTNEAIFSVFPSEKLNLNYYYYLLDRILIHNSNENIYGAKILNQELIKASKLLVPSEEEQTTIANYLDHKTIQLIISANGNPDYFEAVTTLVDNAPKLKHWNFIAFIQPSEDIEKMEAGLDKPYVFKDINLKASEIKFEPLQYENCKKIDMIVYLKNYTIHCNNKNLLQVVYIIIQDIIGEKALSENINFVELEQMPNEENIELIYLYDLQYYLDDINSKKSK